MNPLRHFKCNDSMNLIAFSISGGKAVTGTAKEGVDFSEYPEMMEADMTGRGGFGRYVFLPQRGAKILKKIEETVADEPFFGFFRLFAAK